MWYSECSVFLLSAGEAPWLQVASLVDIVVVFGLCCGCHLHLLNRAIFGKLAHLKAFDLSGWFFSAALFECLLLLGELLEDFVLEQEVTSVLRADLVAIDILEVSEWDDENVILSVFIFFARIFVNFLVFHVLSCVLFLFSCSLGWLHQLLNELVNSLFLLCFVLFRHAVTLFARVLRDAVQ